MGSGSASDRESTDRSAVSPTKDVPCAFCGASVVGADFVLCPSCEVPAHRECWVANGRCPAYACQACDPMEPAIALYRRPRGGQAVAPGAALPTGGPHSVISHRALGEPAPVPGTPGETGALAQAGPTTDQAGDLARRVKALEDHLGAISRRAVGKALGLLSMTGLLVGAILWWPLGWVKLGATLGIGALWSVAFARSARESQIARAMQRHLDDLRLKQIESTLAIGDGRDPGKGRAPTGDEGA